jgi:hypothetical protein
MSPDAVSGATPTLIVADGTKTGLRFQRSGTNDSLNMLMSFAPKIMGDSVRLDIGVAWTGGTMPPANTNLFSCRALLPRTGSLAVECPEARWNDGKHCWFEFYPIVVDSEAKRGKK